MFDAKTATHLASKVGGSPHSAYRDGVGNICLLCIGRSDGGGVAVNEAGLDWLRAQSGGRFVRLSNAKARFEVIAPLERFPEKTMSDGGWGRYAFYDRADFGAEPSFPAMVAEPVPF